MAIHSNHKYDIIYYFLDIHSLDSKTSYLFTFLFLPVFFFGQLKSWNNGGIVTDHALPKTV